MPWHVQGVFRFLTLLGWIFLATIRPAGAATHPGVGRLVQLPATNATCLAVHDTLNLAVIGQRGIPDHHLLVIRLNADGMPAGQPPTALSLQVPEPFRGFSVYPLWLRFHPRLPLLYVWQDLSGPAANSPQEKQVLNEFSHLALYAVTNQTLQLIDSWGRGTNFLYGQPMAIAGLDDTGRRLFVPNLRQAANNQYAIGYYDLDEAGKPVPIPVPIPGTLDGYGVNQYETKLLPIWVNVQSLRSTPVCFGFVAPTPDTVIFDVDSGLGLWDTVNRRGTFGYCRMAIERDHWLTADPAFKAVYGAGCQSYKLIRMTQIDGYLTLLPQLIDVPNAKFQSPPVILAGKAPVLAVGGEKQLYLVPLAADGTFSGPAEPVEIPGGPVRAMAASSRYNRLYATVEKAP